MTNVPQNIREMWTDLYVLFDKHYQMPNTDEAWEKYWDDTRTLFEKHHENQFLVQGFIIIADIISERMKNEERVDL